MASLCWVVLFVGGGVILFDELTRRGEENKKRMIMNNCLELAILVIKY